MANKKRNEWNGAVNGFKGFYEEVTGFYGTHGSVWKDLKNYTKGTWKGRSLFWEYFTADGYVLNDWSTVDEMPIVVAIALRNTPVGQFIAETFFGARNVQRLPKGSVQGKW
jgi:hypothetical protein